jgi:hypothetical protein
MKLVVELPNPADAARVYDLVRELRGAVWPDETNAEDDVSGVKNLAFTQNVRVFDHFDTAARHVRYGSRVRYPPEPG